MMFLHFLVLVVSLRAAALNYGRTDRWSLVFWLGFDALAAWMMVCLVFDIYRAY